MNIYNISFIPSPPYGLNSGVMLMDLPRMTATRWQDKVLSAYSALKKHLAFVDQDLLNLIFHHFPHELSVLPCAANFRPDQCLSTRESCPEALLQSGPLLLHGNRGTCHDGWPFGSALRYLARTAWWYSFNLAYVPYSVKIRELVMGEQRLFKKTYTFFRDLRLEDYVSREEIVVAFRKALTSYELSGDLCEQLIPKMIGSFLNR